MTEGQFAKFTLIGSFIAVAAIAGLFGLVTADYRETPHEALAGNAVSVAAKAGANQ